jgi:hypothetical protein
MGNQLNMSDVILSAPETFAIIEKAFSRRVPSVSGLGHPKS